MSSHEEQQHQRIPDIAQQQVNAARRDQQQEHRLAQHIGDDLPYAACLRRVYFVIAGRGEALLRFRGA